ncbi:nucleoside 2-deoxyribosyltransferase [Cytobacillus sp. FJAT-54145]|uniref:Nucleoside 2-deoxyribosyltransferase n=1 Tax=Cytobacillus spartinae TaxID=3299023 RepID=A0ABW6K7E6_9BACI
MKKFYIASGFTNKETVQQAATTLKSVGFVHTYDWTKNEKANTVEQLREIGTDELKAVKESDFILVILPGGNGTHVELGIALAAYKRVYLYAKNEEDFLNTTFYHVDGVVHLTGEMEIVMNHVIQAEQSMGK